MILFGTVFLCEPTDKAPRTGAEKGADKMINRENDVILAVLKLSRAMRRCPPDPGKLPFPPAIGRLLECVAANNNVSSWVVGEKLDVRLSCVSEMMERGVSEGWI